MAKVKLHLDYDAIGQLLRGDDMTRMITTATSTVKSRCGDGYKSIIVHGQRRVSGRIWTYANKAKADQARNHTIESAIGGGI